MPAPPHHDRTIPKMVSRRASISSHHKGPNTLPDLEDLGKMLETCGLDRGGRFERSQSPNQEECQTCDRIDTCEMAMHASTQRTKQGISVPGEEAQYTKDQGVIKSTKDSEPKVHERATKQDLKTAFLDAARQFK